MERLFYCTETEKLLTMAELQEFYKNAADHDSIWNYGFSVWLEHCLTENNGSLAEAKTVREVFSGKELVYIESNLKTDLF